MTMRLCSRPRDIHNYWNGVTHDRIIYGQTSLEVTRNTMLSFHPSPQSSKTTHIAVAKILLLFSCVAQDFSVSGVGSDQWIRLCTLTSNGSSLMNVAMPCGVQVGSNKPRDDYKDNTGISESWREGDDSVEYVKISLDRDLNITNAKKQPGNLITRQDDDNDDRDVEIESGNDDEGQSAYDEEVTILNVEANEGASEEIEDQLKNRRRGTAVTKVMLGYLLDARNQLYYKIHYLLNLLQRTFFNMELNCRHRRNSIERRSLFNNKRIKGNKKNPSFSSMILEPTFERSIMTMSFLMFGVFVIQVVQKLMQTVQQSGENSFLGNSIFGNLPTASSSIF
ncbi:hypothetical protein ACI65C_000632 [Semiaphis heraclei]